MQRFVGLLTIGAVIAILVVLANGVGSDYQVGGEEGFVHSGGAIIAIALVVLGVVGVAVWGANQPGTFPGPSPHATNRLLQQANRQGDEFAALTSGSAGPVPPELGLHHLADFGRPMGLFAGDVGVIAIEALKALDHYGDLDAATQDVREGFLQGELRALSGRSILAETTATPSDVSALVVEVCRMYRPNLYEAAKRQVDEEQVREVEVAGPELHTHQEPDVVEAHTENWCPTMEANVLMGPDGRCPGCGEVVRVGPSSRKKR